MTWYPFPSPAPPFRVLVTPSVTPLEIKIPDKPLFADQGKRAQMSGVPLMYDLHGTSKVKCILQKRIKRDRINETSYMHTCDTFNVTRRPATLV